MIGARVYENGGLVERRWADLDAAQEPLRVLAGLGGSSRALGLGRVAEVDGGSVAQIAEVSISDRFTIANRFGTVTAGFDGTGANCVPADPTTEGEPNWLPVGLGYGVGADSPGPEVGMARFWQDGIRGDGPVVAVGESEGTRIGICKWGASGAIAAQRSSLEFGTFSPLEDSAGNTDDATDATLANVLRQTSWWHWNERIIAPALAKARAAGERVVMAPVCLLLGGGDALAELNELGGTTNTITQGASPGPASVDRTLAVGAAAKVAANIFAIIRAFRLRWGVPDLGFVVALPPMTATAAASTSQEGFTQMELVRSMMREYLTPSLGVILVESDDLPVKADNIHLTGQGSIDLGERMANAMRRMWAMEVPASIS